MQSSDIKVAVIAGGAGGIGQAVARRLGHLGMATVVLDRDEHAAAAAVEVLRTSGIDATAIGCDITDDSQCSHAVDAVIAERGRIDLLIHSAGLTQISPFCETELSVYRRVMEVNFFGVVNLTKAALPHLVQSHGQVIALSSIAGFAPLWGRTGYCASKYALHGFLETLRVEMREDNVAVTLVCPSFVATGFAERGLRGDGDQLNTERSTTGKLLEPDEVADAIYRSTIRRQRLVVLSRTGRMSYLLSRFAPRLYEHLMLRRIQGQNKS